jgi:hypothetical protein
LGARWAARHCVGLRVSSLTAARGWCHHGRRCGHAPPLLSLSLALPLSLSRCVAYLDCCVVLVRSSCLFFSFFVRRWRSGCCFCSRPRGSSAGRGRGPASGRSLAPPRLPTRANRGTARRQRMRGAATSATSKLALLGHLISV